MKPGVFKAVLENNPINTKFFLNFDFASHFQEEIVKTKTQAQIFADNFHTRFI